MSLFVERRSAWFTLLSSAIYKVNVRQLGAREPRLNHANYDEVFDDLNVKVIGGTELTCQVYDKVLVVMQSFRTEKVTWQHKLLYN